ncbi:MAG: NAD(P)/FAD-dependent oxidoreductase, partial [Nanoarchaeota archaeon]|nr:NAD(P)/FAD-dependent oxidoreductase [Nanoarchaeota archaeon]
GSYLGYLLSKKGMNCRIVEKHSSIGVPEQCTGLISRNIEDIIPTGWVKKAVLNKVNGAVIICAKSSFEVRASQPKAYVFDRPLFDQAIAENAEKKGAEILLGTSYDNHIASKTWVEAKIHSNQDNSKNRIIRSRFLIGADGPYSAVAKNSGLLEKRKFWTGAQVILKTSKPFFQKDMVYVFLDKKYSEGFFAWTVPIDENRAKVGLASLNKPAEHLNRFLKDKFTSYSIEQRQGGIIPIYHKIPLQNHYNNIFLAGDAALQVKATSGGGVVNGMLAARELSRSIISGKSDYEKRISYIQRNLKMHLMIRNKLNRMIDSRKSELLSKLSDQGVKNVLRKKGDMDFPKRFILDLLLAKPSLLKFIF